MATVVFTDFPDLKAMLLYFLVKCHVNLLNVKYKTRTDFKRNNNVELKAIKRYHPCLTRDLTSPFPKYVLTRHRSPILLYYVSFMFLLYMTRQP
jgi:hypothetical protein